MFSQKLKHLAKRIIGRFFVNRNNSLAKTIAKGGEPCDTWHTNSNIFMNPVEQKRLEEEVFGVIDPKDMPVKLSKNTKGVPTLTEYFATHYNDTTNGMGTERE